MTKSNYFAKTIKPEISSEKIPQFYFPLGKTIDTAAEAATRNAINAIFGAKNEIGVDLCKKLVTDVIGLPNYFSICLMSKCANPSKITKL